MKHRGVVIFILLVSFPAWTIDSVAQAPPMSVPVLVPGRHSTPVEDWKFVNQALGYGSCRPPSVSQLMKETCARAIEQSPLCQDIKPEKRRDCSTDFDPTDSSQGGEKVIGCLLGVGYAIGDIFKALNDFLVWYANYFFDGGQTQRQFGSAANQELQLVGDYVAAEYAQAYLETSANDSQAERSTQAAKVTVNNVSLKIWEKVDQFVQSQLAELDCLSPRERKLQICRFYAALAIPPAGLMLIVSSGAKAAAQSVRIKNALQTIRVELRGQRAAELSRATRSDNAVEAVASRPAAAVSPTVTESQGIHSLCNGCPNLRVSDEGLRHLQRHFGRAENWDRVENHMARVNELSDAEKVDLAKDLLPLSRSRVETSVFPGDIKVETVFEAIDKKIEGWTEVPNKQPGRRIMRGQVDVPRSNTVHTYEVEVAFCVEVQCADALGQTFRQGEVISIQPTCGPGVLKVRRTPDIQGFVDGKNGFKRAAPLPVPCT